MKSQRNKTCNGMANQLDSTVTQDTTTWQYKPLALAVLAGMVAAMLPLSISHTASASELDVYEKNGAVKPNMPTTPTEKSGPSLMLMLSNNTTMGCTSIGFDYPELGGLETYEVPITVGGGTETVSNLKCDETPKTVSVGGKLLTYKEYSYTKDGKTYLSRKDRALKGLLDLLDNPEQLPKNTSLGLSFYGFDTMQADAFFNVNGEFDKLAYKPDSPKFLRFHKAEVGEYFQEAGVATSRPVGLIQVPIKPLQKPDGSYDQAFINRLKETAIKMSPTSNYSPVGTGYAEGIAYMLGSTTLDRDNKFTLSNHKVYPIRYSTLKNQFEMCVVFASTGSLCKNPAKDWVRLEGPWRERYMKLLDTDSDGNYIIRKGSDIGVIGGTGKYDHYQYTTIRSSKSETKAATPSGMLFSARDTKNNSTDLNTVAYNSPLDFDNIKNTPSIIKDDCSVEETESAGAYGFYFLTDGLPNAADHKSYADGASEDARINIIQTQMRNVFRDKASDFSCLTNSSSLQGYADSRTNLGRSGWNCILAAAQKLQDKDQNKYPTIRTAVAGYGSVYANGFEGSYKKIDDCSDYETTDIEKQDPKLACKWGQKEYGNGGFYVVNDGAGLAKSIIDFAESLSNGTDSITREYSAQQGDGLTVAADITDSTTSSNFAFLPLMLPRPRSNQLLWPGNVNKYKVMNGSLFDKNDKHIYDSVSGQIKPETTELWNKSGDPDGGAVRAMVVKEKTYKPAGNYAQLTAPDSASKDSTRIVYVEKDSGGIAKISVSLAGSKYKPKVTLAGVPDKKDFTELGYSFQKQQYLLNFLGYDVPVFAGSKRIEEADYTKDDGALKDKTNPMDDISSYAPAPENAIKILGGINNSKPQEIIYQSVEEYDSTTKKTTKTNTTAVLYGSLDGALHLVEGSTGKELFAFIPKPVVNSDRNIAAFKEGSTKLANGTDNEQGKIAYGVDAPWYVDVLLNRKYETNKVSYVLEAIEDLSAGHIHAYGGLGRGGIGFYGLNITDYGLKNKKDKEVPELLFGFDNTKTGFERLGSTWSKPTKAKIQFKIKDSEKIESKDVLFLTGGYDFCYDNPDFKLESSNTTWETKADQKGVTCDNKKQALGNAVYMLDASNGDLLWTAELGIEEPDGTAVKDKSASKNASNKYLKSSIPGEAAIIDTNSDGYVDSIYFADLGGQVFRADFAGEYTKDTGIKSKVTRILDTNNPEKTDNVSLRFFQRPVVSAYRFNITKEKNKTTDITTDSRGVKQTVIVSVASGDRNSPLSTLPERKASKNPNKIISVWNADKVNDTKDDKGTHEGAIQLYKKGSGSDLLKLNFSSTSEEQLANKEKLIDGKTVKGWYDNLTYFKGETVQDEATKPRIQPRKDKEGNVLKDVIGENVSYLRSFGQPVIKGGRLFVSVYNNQVYMSAPEGTCSPVPTGVTEAHEYCLPFGTCNTSNGRGSVLTLGTGVSSANFARIDNGKGSNEFALVTPTEIKKSTPTPTPTPTPTGTKLEEEKGIFSSLYKLLPNRWFERLPSSK